MNNEKTITGAPHSRAVRPYIFPYYRHSAFAFWAEAWRARFSKFECSPICIGGHMKIPLRTRRPRDSMPRPWSCSLPVAGGTGSRATFGTLAIALALFSMHARAQTPTCAPVPTPPGCNSVTTDDLGNVAIGTGSLGKVQTLDLFASGAGNTAAGEESLFSNTGGYGNTAIGMYSLHYNTTGNGNTAAGANALLENTIGVVNTAVGSGALQQNTTGQLNTATGVGALSSNSTGNN